MESDENVCTINTVLDTRVMEKLNSIADENNQTTDDIVSDILKKYTEHKISEMKTIICNDFSFEMLNEDCLVSFRKISSKEFENIVKKGNYINRIGNKEIAKGLNLEFNPGDILLDKHTRLIVVRYNKIFEFYELKYYGQWTYDWIN